MPNLPFSLTEYQQQVDLWVQRHGVRYFSELTNLGILVEETGEVARLMSREIGRASCRERV